MIGQACSARPDMIPRPVWHSWGTAYWRPTPKSSPKAIVDVDHPPPPEPPMPRPARRGIGKPLRVVQNNQEAQQCHLLADLLRGQHLTQYRWPHFSNDYSVIDEG
jgi:hypothetical protein